MAKESKNWMINWMKVFIPPLYEWLYLYKLKHHYLSS